MRMEKRKLKSFTFWVVAFIITMALAIYQRVSGPTYPFRGSANFLGQVIKFKLPRSVENKDNCQIIINLPESFRGRVQGYLEFKKLKAESPWNILAMKEQNGVLVGYLPKQPPAGKLAYYVHLVSNSQEVS
ncbi:MAG: hypothetical protein ACP5SQ_09335, partial [Candidatus Saccharicenans sp.]